MRTFVIRMFKDGKDFGGFTLDAINGIHLFQRLTEHIEVVIRPNEFDKVTIEELK